MLKNGPYQHSTIKARLYEESRSEIGCIKAYEVIRLVLDLLSRWLP